MYSECLSFARIPHTSRLFLDYLYHFDRVQPFFPHPPLGTDWITASAQSLRYEPGVRERVANVLERQNRAWGASDTTLANIERLRRGANAIVTGQQVALFGGPLFSVLKAVSAVRLAREAQAIGVDAVPIFWLATEDHDLAEVNHISLPGGAGDLKTLTTTSHAHEDAPVARVLLADDVKELLASAEEVIGGSEAFDWLREAYRPGRPMGDAFAMLFARMFGEFGVILLDPLDPEFHRIASPVFTGAVEHAQEIDEALLARGKQLHAAGYHEQVKVTASSSLLFTFHEGARTVIRRANGDFTYAGQKVAREDLLARVKSEPEKFSANVLLRPVMQDYLLPTLGYIGGAAEVAYFAQLAVVYEQLLGRITPVLARFSATLVEPAAGRLLKKYHLTLPECFEGPGDLERTLAQRVLPPQLHASLDNADQSLEATMTRVKASLEALDPTLSEAARRSIAKMHYQLNKLRTKAARAEVRRNEVLGRHAAQLTAALFPQKTLQERVIAGVYFVARHGRELLSSLVDSAQVSCPDHQVIHL